MDKLTFGNFNANSTDIAFASTNNYTNPSSNLLTRKQLSYPLKEIKDFVNKTVCVNSEDKAVQLVVSATDKLQYRTEEGGTLHDLTIGDSSAFSFVGMVVSGTNLTTEAKLKEIYGTNTSWTILSSVLVTDSHVYGNGKTLGLTNTAETGDNFKGYGMRGSGDNAYTGLYGTDVGTSSSGSVAGNVGVGVPTKTQVGSNADNTGLIIEVANKNVYTWERTI